MSKKQIRQPFLSPGQKDVCARLAATDRSLTGQRAAALLLINDGATLAETARKTGLTIGQIRYAVARIQKIGLAMFPEPEPAGHAEIPPEKVDKPEVKKKEKGKKKDKRKKEAKMKKGKKSAKKEKKGQPAKKKDKKKKKKAGKGKKKK